MRSRCRYLITRCRCMWAIARGRSVAFRVFVNGDLGNYPDLGTGHFVQCTISGLLGTSLVSFADSQRDRARQLAAGLLIEDPGGNVIPTEPYL